MIRGDLTMESSVLLTKEEKYLDNEAKKLVREYIKLGLVDDHSKDIGGIRLSKEEYDDWD